LIGMNIHALAFDTGGTVLDWHGGLVRALADGGSRHGIECDWHTMAYDFIEHGFDGLRERVLATL
jgi:2-haloacid dehalogenase